MKLLVFAFDGGLSLSSTSYCGTFYRCVRRLSRLWHLGRILLEDALEWVEEVGTIKRLELTVQARNKKARHLYEKFDFELENVKKWGARDENGQLI